MPLTLEVTMKIGDLAYKYYFEKESLTPSDINYAVELFEVMINRIIRKLHKKSGACYVPTLEWRSFNASQNLGDEKCLVFVRGKIIRRK